MILSRRLSMKFFSLYYIQTSQQRSTLILSRLSNSFPWQRKKTSTERVKIPPTSKSTKITSKFSVQFPGTAISAQLTPRQTPFPPDPSHQNPKSSYTRARNLIQACKNIYTTMFKSCFCSAFKNFKND